MDAKSSARQKSNIGLVIVDDHEVVREGLSMVIDAAEGIEVLATAGDVGAALRLASVHRPDVLLLDLLMPGGSVLQTLPRFAVASPETAVVILTMQSKPRFARAALRAGAQGYVLKEDAGIDLVQALRLAHQGRTYLSPSLGARMASAGDPPDGLAPRELEVLRLLALGHTNAEIAGQLYLSPRTVESYRARVQQKTGRSSRSELVRYAMDNQLLDDLAVS
jgi:two-component system response regulator NreC